MFRLFILAFLLSGSLFADDLVQHLRADYEKQTFLVRGFFVDSLLHYSSTGVLKHRGDVGSWTMSYLQINSLQINGDGLEIHAKRVVQVFNDRKRRFEPRKTKLTVVLNVDLDSPVKEEHVRRALDAIFVGRDESLAALVPEPWRWLPDNLGTKNALPTHLEIPLEPTQCGPNPSLDAVCLIEKNVRPPKLVSKGKPSMSKLGQVSNVSGSSILWVVVDQYGKTSQIHIIKPLGCGLDERAIDAVTDWTFQPASRNGQPLTVHINVALRFDSSQFWEMGGSASTRFQR